jgi:hypothetical protein
MMNKIKVLLLATNQLGLLHMRLNEEQRVIKDKMRGSPFIDSFDLIPQPGARISDLGQMLLENSPHVIHFSGRGKKAKGIILEDDNQKITPMNVDQMTAVLRTLKDDIRLIFFNVCYSTPFAEALSQEIDYAIGMDRTIGDDAAIVFASTFYQALAFGRSVSEAFQSAKGIAQAKAPVLFVRPGADASEPFLFHKEYLKKLKSIINQLIDGTASEEDQAMIRRGIDDCNIIFNEIEEAAAIGEGDSHKVIDVSFRNRQLQFRLGSSDRKRVLSQIFPDPPGIVPPFTLLPFIGREDAIKDVKDFLGRAKEATGKSKITVVRGWPGVGKTTLISRICRDPDIAKIFPDGILWNFLEQTPNLLSEMARWGRALGTDEILRAPTIKEAAAQMATLLRHRRMLLIVDDVWETAHAVPFTQIIGDQCALVVTTRLPEVASDLTTDEERVYRLPVLTEEYALKLLSVLVPLVVEQHQEECRELIRDLECLPLALQVAGRLLRNESRRGWGVSDLIKELREETNLITALAPEDRGEEGKIPTVGALLKKSTDMLDEFTRDCFAYLGAFAPKPATFDLAAMKAVWKVDDAKPIVRKLEGHGLLELVGSGRFQMHRILVDHAKSLCID